MEFNAQHLTFPSPNTEGIGLSVVTAIWYAHIDVDSRGSLLFAEQKRSGKILGVVVKRKCQVGRRGQRENRRQEVK